MPEPVLSQIGRYAVVAHIASGGMGAVYRAIDSSLNRTVALKVLSPDLAGKANMLERFRREARSAAKLHHENIVAVYEFGEVHGTFYLAMEYVSGIDLHEYIVSKPNGQIDVDEAKQIIIQAAKALDHAHRLGITHRDIKPSNFLICAQGEDFKVKLTDFGLARENTSEDFRLTKDNTTLGTVDYISPEQAKDSGMADIRSDLYSLGCTYYHMVAGHAPFPTGSLTERILAHFQKEAPDVRRLNSAVPDRIWNVLRKLLAKNPADRYQLPLELLRDLETPERFLAYLKQSPEGERTLVEGGGPRVRAFDPTVVLERSSGEGLDVLPDTIGFADEKPAPVHVKKPIATKPIAKPAAAKLAAKPGPETPEEMPTPHPRKTPEELPISVRTETKTAGKPKRQAERKPHAPEMTHKHAHVEKNASAARKMWILAGAGGVFLIGLIATLIVVFTREAPKPQPSPPPVVNLPVELPPQPPPKPTPLKPTPPKPAPPPFGPYLANLKPIPAASIDVAKARKDFLGPFATPPSSPSAATTILVSRAPIAGKQTVPTLHHAWKEASQLEQAIIEIHDRGPHFVSTLPPLNLRHLVVQAGPGVRPLIVWDVQPTSSAALAAFVNADVTLRDLDIAIVARTRAEAPIQLFHLEEGAFHAWNSHVQQVGSAPQGCTVVRLASNSMALAQIDFHACTMRGDDLQAVRLEQVSADVLFENSLMVGGKLPAIDWTHREVKGNSVRFVNSTLVAHEHLLRWRADASGATLSPILAGWAFDSVLARQGAGSGNLLHLDAGVLAANVTWNVVNSAYVGWNDLLHSPSVNIATLEQWRARNNKKEGDVLIADPWTAEAGDDVFGFLTHRLGIGSVSRPGALGCPLEELPPQPYPWQARVLGWLETNYDGLPLPQLPFPDAGKPEIPGGDETRYSGELIDADKLTLEKFDLAAHVEANMRTKKLADKIVIQIRGKGVMRSSPLKLAGVHLILHVDKSSGLELATFNLGSGRPFLEIEDGKLELINVRLRPEGAMKLATPPILIRGVGSDLHLTNCRLEGGKSGESLRTLISLEAKTEHEFHRLTLRECVLKSPRSAIEVKGQSLGVSAEGCLFLSAGSVFALVPGEPVGPRPDVFLFLRKSTCAWKASLVHVVGTEDEIWPAFAHPLVVQASQNYFLNPFGGTAPLLRGDGSLLQHGVLIWQGKNNVFDAASLKAMEQSSVDWAGMWGPWAETNSKWVDAKRDPELVQFHAPKYSLLALPKSAGVTPIPGANLKVLGLAAN